jgi:outer membrane protein assembly factor BamD (BamD/ComL family)
MRLVAPLLLAAASVAFTAPLQCARKTGPEMRTEDDPAEVLYTLAERFKAQGNAPARTETLRYLVSRYPESRFAQAARLDLGPTPSPPAQAP